MFNRTKLNKQQGQRENGRRKLRPTRHKNQYAFVEDKGPRDIRTKVQCPMDLISSLDKIRQAGLL